MRLRRKGFTPHQTGLRPCGNFPAGAGFTLIELIMGILILSVAFLTLGSTFTSIGKSLLVNKTKTIASNLAQEKIESLKNLSYYRLLVSTAVDNYDSNFPNMYYDKGTTPSYYPEETLTVGDRLYLRRTLVEFVRDESGNFVGESWTANDTGIKRVTVYVVWKEGDDWKKVELRNLRNNPDRATLDYTFSGKVTSGTTANTISNALIETQENPSYFARTDANGNYAFKVSAGSYTLRASATGYFTSLSTPYAIATGQTGSSTHDFALPLKAVGNATGYVYIQDHLIITEIVHSTQSDDNTSWEWVELYNPTTYNILIASRSTPNENFNVFFITVSYICLLNDDPTPSPDTTGAHGEVPKSFSFNLIGNNPGGGSNNGLTVNFRNSSNHWTVNTTTISIPSNHFFLIANASTITAVSGLATNRIADAYYIRGGGEANNVIKANEFGGIRVTGVGGYSFNSKTDWHDGFSWENDAGANSCPGLAREGGSKCFEYYDLGYSTGRLFFRYAVVENPVTTGGTIRFPDYSRTNRGTPPFAANCFDRNITADDLYAYYSDWFYQVPTLGDSIFYVGSSVVLNSDVTMPCFSGTPAAGASVSANDDLSGVAFVAAYGSFTLTNIATGTWSVTIASGNYIRDISSMTITPNLSTRIVTGNTVPAWQFPTISWGYVPLTTSSIYGYISGVVKDREGQPMNGASVSASGASGTTNAQGRYRLSVDASAGPVSVTASKSGFATEIVDNIGLAIGLNVSSVNFNLISAGSIRGFVTTNGAYSGSISGIPVVAMDLSSGTTLGSAITKTPSSDNNGSFNFFIPSVSTGRCVVSLQLESGETASPETKVISVISNSTGTWSSTFTITNAYGTITGSVGAVISSPITTGVLVVASSYSISSESPPTMDNGLRTGASVQFSVSSDPTGVYSLPVLGNTSYYIYGWFPQNLDVSSSSSPKRYAGRRWVGPGVTVTQDIAW